MANELEEQLSALVDGEHTEGEFRLLLERMHREPELRERWTRYHLIRDALQKNLPRSLGHDLHERVGRALRDEPTLLVPRRRRLSPPLKKVVGLAIAASVATVAILSVQRMNQDATHPVASAPAANAQLAATPPSVPSSDNRLDPYLVNHTEHAASSGMHGMLPYVRIVSEER